MSKKSKKTQKVNAKALKKVKVELVQSAYETKKKEQAILEKEIEKNFGREALESYKTEKRELSEKEKDVLKLGSIRKDMGGEKLIEILEILNPELLQNGDLIVEGETIYYSKKLCMEDFKNQIHYPVAYEYQFVGGVPTITSENSTLSNAQGQGERFTLRVA